MQTLSLFLFFLLAVTSLSFGETSPPGDIIPGHSDLIHEIITIHDQMNEVDKLLAKNPQDPDLQHIMEKMEEKLVMKLRQYNQTRQELTPKLRAP